MDNKEKNYFELLNNIKILTEGEDDIISKMSTISCEVFHTFEHFNWVGFYRSVGNRKLKVGPYQGGHGCLVIDYDRGVCGKCAREEQIQIENDVTKLSHHIACSSETKAEIVLPVIRDGELIAVFDIDSVDAGIFDEIDIKYLSRITELL